jgi:hypothetical protein
MAACRYLFQTEGNGDNLDIIETITKKSKVRIYTRTDVRLHQEPRYIEHELLRVKYVLWFCITFVL